MNWKIEFTKQVAKQINSLEKSVQDRIENAIKNKLLTNPDKYLIGLVGELSDFYKFRVGDYRLLCDSAIILLFT